MGSKDDIPDVLAAAALGIGIDAAWLSDGEEDAPAAPAGGKALAIGTSSRLAERIALFPADDTTGAGSVARVHRASTTA